MKIVLSLFFVLVLTAGCLKKDSGCPYSPSNTVAPASEEQMVKDYLTAHNIAANKHASNMYYQVLTQGAGNRPELCSKILINYTGRLTSGAVFDQSNNAVFELGALIEGWKLGLPLIAKGGSIRLFIPPSLGYGDTDVKDANGNVIIPGKSVLVFDISLLDVR
jgi:FKBP-type peptidyl-prolyl cis-trans isomerase FkpA